MDTAQADYDPRYLAGILFFNSHDYFEAHEVWEEIWMHCTGPERKFYQGLIQAAVALFHFRNGNRGGATKLYHSGNKYMSELDPTYHGLDIAHFWKEMGRVFAPLFDASNSKEPVYLQEDMAPHITVDPPPEAWPDPTEFVTPDE